MGPISTLTWMMFILTCCITTQACRHAKLSTSNRRFGSLVLDILSKQQDNAVLSSISLHETLSLLYYGSSGRTQSTLRNVLDLPDQSDTANGYKTLIDYVRSRPNVSMLMLNRMYVSGALQLVNEFQIDAARYFDTEIKSINFGDPSAIAEINTWARRASFYQIGDIVSYGQVDPSTQILLLNSLMFMGGWLHKFTVIPTPQVFVRSFNEPRLGSGPDLIMCQMMTVTGNFEHYSNYDPRVPMTFSYIRLPYVDSTLSLVIVLPGNVNELPDLEKKIASDSAFFDFRKERRNVVFTMPKFRIDHKTTFNSILRQIGLGSIFNHIEIPNIVNAAGDVRIDGVIQSVLFEANEFGSQAAAVSLQSFAPMGNVSTIMTVNHPFLFYLEANAGGERYVLLQGKVNTPRYY